MKLLPNDEAVHCEAKDGRASRAMKARHFASKTETIPEEVPLPLLSRDRKIQILGGLTSRINEIDFALTPTKKRLGFRQPNKF